MELYIFEIEKNMKLYSEQSKRSIRRSEIDVINHLFRLSSAQTGRTTAKKKKILWKMNLFDCGRKYFAIIFNYTPL